MPLFLSKEQLPFEGTRKSQKRIKSGTEPDSAYKSIPGVNVALAHCLCGSQPVLYSLAKSGHRSDGFCGDKFTSLISLDKPAAKNLSAILRNQERGVSAKRVSAESSVTPKEAEIIKDIGPSSTFGAQSATAKRGVHVCKNPLSKN